MERINAPGHYYYQCNCACGCDQWIGPVGKKVSTYLVDVLCGDCGSGCHLPGYFDDKEGENE